jgi:hypothetical protein
MHTMLEYRAFIVRRDGYFQKAIEFVSSSDADATEQATEYVDGHDVEL